VGSIPMIHIEPHSDASTRAVFLLVWLFIGNIYIDICQKIRM
jgi:hypothetical protein